MKQLMVQFAKIRKHRRISYLELERHTGITFARMKQLETGDAAITVDELEALLGFYQLTFDQVRKFKRWNKLVIPALATLVIGVLLFCAFYFFPDLGGVVQRFQKAGQETVEDEVLEQPGDFPEDTGLIVDEKETETPTPPDDAAPTETDQISPDEHAANPASPPAEDSEETVIFRFWGNIPYHAERLPEATDHAHARVVDIVPIQYLDDTRPDWLQDVNRDQLILNAGTSEVWTPTTVEAYEALQADQYQMLGLGTLPDVYEPLIMEVNDLKIGFLSMAGLIRNAEEIALASGSALLGRTGLTK